MAEGCGICPNFTSNSCVTCVSNNPASIITCTFSVQSVVCESISGNFSDPVTFQLGGTCITANNISLTLVPDAPTFDRILPYYSDTSHKLFKLDLYFSTTSNVTVSMGIIVTINYFFTLYTRDLSTHRVDSMNL